MQTQSDSQSLYCLDSARLTEKDERNNHHRRTATNPPIISPLFIKKEKEPYAPVESNNFKVSPTTQKPAYNYDQIKTSTSEWETHRLLNGKERINTEENFLLTSFAGNVADNFTDRPRPLSDDKGQKRSSGWLGLPSWLCCKIFNRKKNVSQISPEAFGITEQAADGEVKKALKRRAKRNWEKARYLYNIAKVTGALSRIMAERESKIAIGKSSREIKDERKPQNWISVLKNWYVSPNSKGYLAWKFVFQTMSIFFILVMPYVMAFRIYKTPLNLVLYIIDFFYLIDIILHFFVAIKSDLTGDLITKRKTIALSYLKILRSTFIADVIAIIPYDLFDEDSGAQILKLIRIVRVFVILKFIRQLSKKICSFFASTSIASMISSFMANFLALLLILIVCCHFGACFWIAIGYPLEPGEVTWFSRIDPTGLIIFSELAHGSYEVYLCSLYHVVQTLTVVGYGDYTNLSVREELTCLVLELFGILLFTFTIQQLKYTITQLDDMDSLDKVENEEIEEWLAQIERSVGDSRETTNNKLMKDIKSVLRYINTNDQMTLFADNSFFKSLPPYAKLIALKATFTPLINKFHMFFNYISDILAYELLMNAEAQSLYFCPRFCKGETIIQRGKHSSSVYFIEKGSIILVGRKQEDVFRKLDEGSFFGELSIATEKASTISYVAYTRMECLVINKEVFEEAGKKYPKEMKKLQGLAFQRNKYFLYAKANQEKGIESNDAKTYFNTLLGPKVTQLRRNSENVGRASNIFVGNTKTSKEDLEVTKKFIERPTKTRLPSIALRSNDKIFKADFSVKVSVPKLQTAKSLGVLEDSDDSTSDEENLSETSDLQSSEICPIEAFDINFEDAKGSEQFIEYLKGRMEYSYKKLDILKRKVSTTLEVIKRIASNKAKEYSDNNM